MRNSLFQPLCWPLRRTTTSTKSKYRTFLIMSKHSSGGIFEKVFQGAQLGYNTIAMHIVRPGAFHDAAKSDTKRCNAGWARTKHSKSILYPIWNIERKPPMPTLSRTLLLSYKARDALNERMCCKRSSRYWAKRTGFKRLWLYSSKESSNTFFPR